jgi:hypothetical protein
VLTASLLGEGTFDRKGCIEHRLQELAQVFSEAVAGFAILDNHLHVLVQLDPDVAKQWSDEDVVRRWGSLFPPRDKSRQPIPVFEDWVQSRLKDATWVATERERLQSLGWFMKCLKEPLSRLANREEQTRGALFEGRFKSVAILDEESLLATGACIDLNPVAAGVAEVPEASKHTSIRQRVEHVKEQERATDLNAPRAGGVSGSKAAADQEGGRSAFAGPRHWHAMSGFATTSKVHASPRPRAFAQVLRVPIVGLAILPVSSLLIVARSIPVRSAISVRLNPCRSRSRLRASKASINSVSPTGGYSCRSASMSRASSSRYWGVCRSA